MFLLDRVWSLLLLSGYVAYVQDFHSMLKHRRSDVYTGLENTFFSSLENYQVEAREVLESEYPWIGRVVHSRLEHIPHICTAICLDNRIFATAYRCIASLKLHYTTILYKNQLLQSTAFVLPSNGSKQAFDDIAFIVLDHVDISWSTIKAYSGNRTDDGFRWFAEYVKNKGSQPHKVVGYATRKGMHRIKAANVEFNLTELNVVVGIDMCSTIFTFNNMIKGFYVPCYHSCGLEDFKKKDEKCKSYHGVEGGAVVNMKTNELIGVATWGPYFSKYTLPVGFSVPNSPNYFKDFECARSIRDNEDFSVHNKCY